MDMQDALPQLSKRYEKRLKKNLPSLSMVETNLAGALWDRKRPGAGTGGERRGAAVYVTSCFNGEGKTSAAVSMAYALTINRSKKVLLVDGNPRSPRLHELFASEPQPGLSEVFHAGFSAETAIRKTAHDDLSIMTFGNPQPERTTLFSRRGDLEIFDRLRCQFDFIIFDGQSLIGSSDSSLIARNFDGIVMVVECEKTKLVLVKEVMEKERKHGSEILGVVLNKRRYYLPRLLHERI